MMQPMTSTPETLLREIAQTQGLLTAHAARLDALATVQEERLSVQETRLAALETAAGERIRGLQATVADQADTLRLAGETMTAVMDVCARHGYDPASGLTALEWLAAVLPNAARGWPSVN